MVQNAEKLEMATQFRKRGFSYSEIANICGVSKSTVSNWLAKKPFSKKVKADNIKKASRENAKRIALLHKARQAERQARYRQATKDAETEFKHYRAHPLFIAGLMLYLASGDTTNSGLIRLSSKQTDEHRLFIKFLTEYTGLSKKNLKCWLLLPAGARETAAVTHWSKKIALPKARFGKTQFLSHNENRPLHNGTGNTIIADTVLKHKLLRWLELATKELQK